MLFVKILRIKGKENPNVIFIAENNKQDIYLIFKLLCVLSNLIHFSREPTRRGLESEDLP